ncbi:DEAD/DEAH box helicase [Planctomicrobium sp. SH661]|uniref:DEAD/DEAH box helicase n=1 Tax=Planctomicrobium sp. SH661 TaxID=3448124 RepID=UPI003F5C60DB
MARDALASFHPVIQDWFRSRFQGPTEPQAQGWPSIAAGEHTLISAPTGSGKTLTAFLAVIDRLFRQAAAGELEPGLQVVYISPLRALSNDMQRNLEGPLAEIHQTAAEWGIDISPLRTGLRTGDTSAYQRAQIVKNPPHILVTTPESLYLLLTSEKSREMLRSVNTVIVDEIHALVRDKRGSHLALSLERLEALTSQKLQRIGLSATQKPIERMADFLVGVERRELSVECQEKLNGSLPENSSQRSTLNTQHSLLNVQRSARIVNVGHSRELDLAVEVPPSDLQAACSHEQWAEVNARIVELINSHRSTLIFVNTRRLAERLTHQLTQLLGEEAVGSHHGSLSKEIRLDTEQRLKNGELKAVVATSSLELGIDVGYIDLVIQIGSPRGIAPFLQRIGRSGHALGLVPRGRLFALTRDELVECMALIRAVRNGRLDVTPIPIAPLDILAQQIVAELATAEWDVDQLYSTFTRAWPYQSLTRESFEQTLDLLSTGLTGTEGRGRAMIYYDRINGRVKGRRAARLLALSNGGAIAEIDSVRVVLEDENTVVGSVDEEFAVESSSGDIFLLGNTSWRIQRLRGNDLIVTDAQGAPPTIPFWRGEAPGRTIELSEEIARLREEVERRLIQADQEHGSYSPSEESPTEDVERPAKWHPIAGWLQQETLSSEFATWQVVIYMASQRAAIGLLPTQNKIVFERFFDESGGMQLVVHAPFGGRINRGWGLAFRKRFCRSFDFELQASADDDGFLLSLGPQHSFPIESLFPMMRTDNARNLLEQALLVAPMFHLRWRWNITRSLFLERMRSGKKVPPALQRFRSEDMLTAVFPKLTGCQENIVGDHEIPDHPLMRQTVEDCLFEALDIDGLTAVLGKIEAGEITLIGRDTREPSPFAYELLNANPYAFLDGGEVQERRARAVATRRSLSVEGMRDLGRLDPRAIHDVVAEAQPEVRDADELHDLLVSRILIPIGQHCDSPAAATLALAANQLREKEELFEELREQGRAVRVSYQGNEKAHQGWIATECWSAISTLFPEVIAEDPVSLPASLVKTWEATEALVSLLRGWLETCGPVTACQLADLLGLPESRISASLEAIEGEGLILRGRFLETVESASGPPPLSTLNAQPSTPPEWCHRRLLARIHRRTISGLRQEIEAVDPSVYLEFLARSQGVLSGHHKQGVDGLHEVISQLQGTDVAAGAWEQSILPLRVEGYRSSWLDELCLSGSVGWGRLEPQAKRKSSGRPMASMTRAIPVSLFLREDQPWLMQRSVDAPVEELSPCAQELLALLQTQGALFSSDLCQRLKLLPSQLDELLGELVAYGWLTADGFAGLRQLINSGTNDSRPGLPSRYRRVRQRTQGLGRWTLMNRPESDLTPDQHVEEWAWQLIRRWGVVFRDLVLRECLAPQWWELLKVYRRLEARGELRGGRFIRGVSGEQFATSEAIRELRSIRSDESPAQLLILSGADPLNLTGVVGSGMRIPGLAAHGVAYRKGQVVGWKKGEDHWIFSGLSKSEQHLLASQWGIVGTSETVQGPEHRETERTSTEAELQAEKKKRRNRTPARAGIPKPFPF